MSTSQQKYNFLKGVEYFETNPFEQILNFASCRFRVQNSAKESGHISIDSMFGFHFNKMIMYCVLYRMTNKQYRLLWIFIALKQGVFVVTCRKLVVSYLNSFFNIRF